MKRDDVEIRMLDIGAELVKTDLDGAVKGSRQQPAAGSIKHK
jgi:hypothetical protein